MYSNKRSGHEPLFLLGKKEKLKVQNETGKEKGLLNPRSFDFSLSIIRFIDTLDQKDLSVQVISKQLIRSATSVGANIVEAQAGSSRKDFANFYSYALKSANETKFWLDLLKSSGKCNTKNAENLLLEGTELSNIIAASIITLRAKH